ncbi:class II aldolase/adducin family protein [Amphritea pacifica]|uniref:Class II aldolase/adducin family protein n=1 Tax=Amphritea pacifica TaxID=2811233 RepID=A0ABS2W7T5_9GAMM|nr:class II aldolase/adducin family protein [Amphritea pacifica]MBN0987643.1 class II aldolase/adducin family protein [Amphritea pacifica]MBN1009057.1 class II aldolase/adducin family protein [Amphritea pacifica]
MLASNQRQRVVDLCVDLSQRGFLAGTGGNVALRIDAELIAVTPSAIDYLSMTAADVCVVRLSDLEKVDGQRDPSVETGLHAQLLRQRPEVNCSIHTHQPIASACTLLGKPLHVTEAKARQRLGRRVPMIGYMPSGTGLLAGMVKRAIRSDSNAYLMRNHGVLCCGDSIESAIEAVETLESQALAWLRKGMSTHAHNHPEQADTLQRVRAVLGGIS